MMVDFHLRIRGIKVVAVKVNTMSVTSPAEATNNAFPAGCNLH